MYFSRSAAVVAKTDSTNVEEIEKESTLVAPKKLVGELNNEKLFSIAKWAAWVQKDKHLVENPQWILRKKRMKMQAKWLATNEYQLRHEELDNWWMENLCGYWIDKTVNP